MGENNGDEAVRTDFGAFRLLLASSTDTFRSVVVIAAIVSSVVFLSGYGIAHHGGFGRAYLQSVVVYLVLNSGVVLGVIAGLILMSLSIFWIPQLAIHATLSAAKQERLATITDEYDDLLDRCRSASGSPDHLTAELEIVEAQRRNAAGIRTWSYNLPFLLQVGASAVASTGLWLLEMRNLL